MGYIQMQQQQKKSYQYKSAFNVIGIEGLKNSQTLIEWLENAIRRKKVQYGRGIVTFAEIFQEFKAFTIYFQ